MPNELAVQGHDFTPDQLGLIQRTICVGATPDELAMFFHMCKRTGLDPLAKQIHMVKRWNSQAKREVATIQTGIDGYRLIADRTGKLAGISDATYGELDSKKNPISATVTVTKIVGEHRAEFTATARFSEYVQVNREGAPNVMWSKMPYLMIAKCAEALALRKAFPADLSGVYTAEEMMQADSEPRTVAATLPKAPETQPKALPVEAEYVEDATFAYDAPNLLCQPIDVEQRTSKGANPRPFVAIKLNGDCEGQRLAFCWHQSVFDALLGSVGKTVTLKVSKSKGEKPALNIDDVLTIDGEPVSEGKEA